MYFLIEPLLTSEQCNTFLRALDAPEADWRPGADTAGWHARTVKQNQQLASNSYLRHNLQQKIQGYFLGNPLFQAAAFPRSIHSILFSRYSAGQSYGRHVDNAWMGANRSDLSFTLALNSTDDYTGGELVLELPTKEQAFRLPQGHALVYPSTLLHRVEPVTSGERMVAVGWIQSRIRHADQRELLFDLDTARRALFGRSGKDELFDLISRSYTNLLRRWDD